jgi:hypothetical protein
MRRKEPSFSDEPEVGTTCLERGSNPIRHEVYILRISDWREEVCLLEGIAWLIND